MKIIDLHTHSNYSDGTLSPADLVAYAEERSVSAIALTDHDTAAGLNGAEAAGKNRGIEIIPGIELVAEYKDSEIHILGYFIDYKGQYFINALEGFKKIRVERNERLIKRLATLNMTFAEEDLHTGEAALTRVHFAKAMLKRGYVKSAKEAFEKYLNPGCPAFVGRNAPSYGECIETIIRAKGIAVLAHPYSYKWAGGEVTRMVEELCAAGIGGVEAIYPYHTPAQTATLTKTAERLGIVITGGSDFHGGNRPEIELGTGKGTIRVGYEILEELRLANGKNIVV